MTVKPIQEETYNDAAEVVRMAFGSDSAVSILRKEMQNPLRSLAKEIGFVGYEGGKPVCLQVFILRTYYLAKERIVAKIGAMSGRVRDSGIESFVDVKARFNKPTAGSVFRITNSMNPQSAAISKRTKSSRPVPESCARYIWRAVRPLSCLLYFIRRKIFKLPIAKRKSFSSLNIPEVCFKCRQYEIRRVKSVATEFFDTLMDKYLDSNDGVVGCRRVEDIEWIYGDRIRSGQIVVLGAFCDNEPVGCMMMDGKSDGYRWMICDLFAIKNDEHIIDGLLKAACKYLRKYTPAMILETIGFPTFIQSTLRKYLSHIREVGHSTTAWNVYDRSDRAKFEEIIDTPRSWLFGPYDGDLCL